MLRLAAFILFTFCASSVVAKPLVVTSVNPLALIVNELSGDQVEVRSIVKISAHEHSGEITPSQANDLAKADLIVLVGLGQEAWQNALSKESRSKAIEFSALVPTDSVDPHMWLDPVLINQLIPALSEKLCTLKDVDCGIVKTNGKKISGELVELDQELNQKFSNLSHHQVIAFHPAWNRFAKRYNLEIVANLTPTGEEEPSARTLLEINQRFKHVPVIVEPSTSTQMQESVSAQLDSPLVQLDPQLDCSPNYTECMRQSAQRLINALKSEP